MLYDTHCHPYLSKQKSQEEIIYNFSKSWDFLNSIWVDIETSKKSIALAKKYDFVHATIWIHPCDILEENDWKHTLLDLDKTLTQLEELYLENKQYIVWFGEMGFDFHWLESMSQNFLKTQIWEDKYDKIEEGAKNEILSKISHNIKSYQELFFKAQIKLSHKYNLPIIIHNRDSKDDVFRVLQEENCTNFIFHCYSEDFDYAQKIIDFAPDCKISFSWIVTFSSAKEIQKTATNIPLKNILVETDAPYLTPTPLRGKEENEPLFTKYVLEKIIELREETWEEIEKQIFENSIEIFNIE